jgi:tRNA(fMet)-specific endonuclease VapC
MKYLLDTNICIYWFKGSMGIDRRVAAVDIDDVSVSSITIAELLYGAYNSANIEKNISKVKEFEDATNVIDLDRESLEHYARIKAKLRAEGKMLDDFDILIAATAIVNGCVLVTNNAKHFERIDGLTIENWISQ